MITIRQYLSLYKNITSCGWLSIGEGLLLLDYAEQTSGPMIEVGSHFGRSAMLLAQLPSDEGHLLRRKLYCIDPWGDDFHTEFGGDEIYAQFLSNINTIPNAWVVPIRKRVEETKPIDSEFVYLDGDHTPEGTKAQIAWALKCQPKYIAVHDVNESGDGLKIKNVAIQLLGNYVERVERLAVWRI